MENNSINDLQRAHENGLLKTPNNNERKKNKFSVTPYLLISPFLISFLIFFGFPAVYSLILSFYRYRGYGSANFVGFDNYIALLTYPTFWLAVWNTVFYLIAHTVPVMILAFLLAIILSNKVMKKIQKFYKPIIFLPQVTAIVAAAMVWRVILSGRDGVLNHLLGTKIQFIEDPRFMKWSVVLLIVWRSTSWFMVVFLAGLTTISDEINDAAMIDGASGIRRLWHITIPMMMPIFMFSFIIDAINSLKLFTEPTVLIAANVFPPVQSATILNMLVNNLNGGSFGTAAAVGWILFVMIFLVTQLLYRFFKERTEV